VLAAAYSSDVMMLICDRYKSASQQDIGRLLTFAVLRNDVCRAGSSFRRLIAAQPMKETSPLIQNPKVHYRVRSS
jgi:hypothetical protein